MYDLEGRKILVVGASSGIGERTARVLSEQGAFVILVARREDLLEKICDEIGADKCRYYAADISNITEIENLISTIVLENGKLDGMAYVAGIVEDFPLKYMTYDRLLDVFNVNYFAFIECVRQITKKANYNRGLRIVAVSSVAAIRGEKAHTSYSASKAAIDATVRCLAKELCSKGIALNTVQPSMIKTEMYEKLLELQGEDCEANHLLLTRQYAGIGETEDVAYAISFLLSPKAKFITGVSLPVDGGYSAS